jgi:rfaE bifunctional protein kinase chain/domain
LIEEGSIADKLVDAMGQMAGHRVLVIGDIFLDEYLIGRPTRLSREAPVPVLEFGERRTLPGGAANPACNIAALHAEAVQIGIVGADEQGKELLICMKKAGIDVGGIIIDSDRPTTVKTRIVAQGSLRFAQQLARLDRLDRRPPNHKVQDELLARLADLAPAVDALLISDYRTGLVTPRLVAVCRELAREHKLLLTTDTQGELEKYRSFDLLKCNHHEAAAALGYPLETDEDFRTATKRLLSKLEAGAIIITRGPQGMSVRGEGADGERVPYTHIMAANVSEVFDVTGAGDTVIAVATLGLVAGLNLLMAARLANYAAGLVVRKLGNASPTPEELAWAVRNW